MACTHPWAFSLRVTSFCKLAVSGSWLAFEADSASGTSHAGDPVPARIYAVTGDIVSLQLGENRAISSIPAIQWYVAAKAADIRAGGDIVNFGQSNSSRSLILDNSLSDVSVVSAGNEADLLRVGLLEQTQSRALGLLAHFGLAHLA